MIISRMMVLPPMRVMNKNKSVELMILQNSSVELINFKRMVGLYE